MFMAANHEFQLLLGFDVFYASLARLCLPRPVFGYLVLALGAAAVLVWQFFFRKHEARNPALLAGLLLGGAICLAVFGALVIWRAWLFAPWYIILGGVAWVWFRQGWDAFVRSARLRGRSYALWTASAGAALIVVGPIVAIPQPWSLVVRLPRADGVDLHGAHLNGVFLDGCAGASLRGANLDDADLSGSDLGRCDLDLSSATLRRSDLSDASLDNVDLRGADLRGADLSRAELYMVVLVGANLAGANLGLRVRGRVNMSHTNLVGANLSEMEDPAGVYSWRGAEYDETTLWPQDFDPEAMGTVRVDRTTGELR